MKKMIVTGKTIDETIAAGMEKWGVPAERIKVNVIEEPVKGLFGIIGSRDAKVELELIVDAIEEAENFLKDVLEKMGIDVRVEVERKSDHVLFQMYGSELGIVIGRRGQTLDALQYLLNVIANRRADEYVRIVLDGEDFRKRRKETLENLALRLAKRAMRTGKEIILEPMSPQDRKIIHSVLQDHERVVTYSKGQEPNRRIVIDVK